MESGGYTVAQNILIIRCYIKKMDSKRKKLQKNV